MAEAKNRYFRTFFIFEQEDLGFGTGQAPSGYIKIESRDGKGTLQASVQNLKEGNGRNIYQVYLFKAGGGQFSVVHAGDLTLSRNKAELKWDFDAGNVGMTGVPVQDFNVAAIIVKPEHAGNSFQCPLAGYKGDKIPWRDGAKRQLIPPAPAPVKKEEFVEEILERKNPFTQYLEGLEVKEPVKPEEAPEIAVPEEVVPEEAVPKEAVPKEAAPEETKVQEEVQAPVAPAAPAVEEAPADTYPKYKSAEEILAEENPFQMTGNKDTEDCILKNNTYCTQDNAGEGYQACINCYARNVKAADTGDSKPVTNVMEKLRKSFDQYFTKFDPFGSRRRDYQWWKVNSPVYLNNILYQCNVRTPLLFNPVVMMAHFKFRHLAIGLFSDRYKRREFIVCGIPGVFGVDTQPFGELCRWVQIEGNVPKYGAFGYWVVYMDPRTGKFLDLA